MGDTTIYKVLKQGYPATYNFKDEADGTSGTDIDFVDSATLYNGALEIIASWQGHRKVLRLTDDVTAGEDPNFAHNMTQATSGTVEFFIGGNNTEEYIIFRIREDGKTIVRFRIIGDQIYYYDGGIPNWVSMQVVADNILYCIKKRKK